MGRYFFDLQRDGEQERDTIGSDLASDQAAEEEAVVFLQELTQSAPSGVASYDLQTEVRNAAGHVISRPTGAHHAAAEPGHLTVNQLLYQLTDLDKLYEGSGTGLAPSVKTSIFDSNCEKSIGFEQ